MDIAHPGTLVVPMGVAALVGWRVYRRIKRFVGRQRLSNVRPWLTVVFFPLLVALLFAGVFRQPSVALALAAGVVIGIALGVYGIRVTKFEQAPEGLFYTPNAHLGIALSLLFVGRMAYRLMQLYLMPAAAQQGAAAFGKSPVTLLIFGTLAGYYVAYAIGLLRWKHRAALTQ